MRKVNLRYECDCWNKKRGKVNVEGALNIHVGFNDLEKFNIGEIYYKWYKEFTRNDDDLILIPDTLEIRDIIFT